MDGAKKQRGSVQTLKEEGATCAKDDQATFNYKWTAQIGHGDDDDEDNNNDDNDDHDGDLVMSSPWRENELRSSIQWKRKAWSIAIALKVSKHGFTKK